MERDMTPEGLIRLKQDEGLNLTMYQDTTGHATIGWGHNLTINPISLSAAEIILADDIHDAMNEAETLPFFASLSGARGDVIVNMIFNLGMMGFLEFKHMHECLLMGNWSAAAESLWLSVAASQLPNRYRRLYWTMITDSWNEADWHTRLWKWPGDIGRGPPQVSVDNGVTTA